MTTFEGLRRPWRHLARYVPDLVVQSALWGNLACGLYCPRAV